MTSHKASEASEKRAKSGAIIATFDTFTRSYVETMLFLSTDNSTPSGGYPLDRKYSIGDIDAESLTEMQADCTRFRAEQANDLEEVERMWEEGEWAIPNRCDSVEELAGYYFALTRSRSGHGFWAGDWPEASGERLTEASHGYSEQSLYVGDDGVIYLGSA